MSSKQRKISMGKGLSTVLGNVANLTSNPVTTPNHYVPLSAIMPNPDQPRKHFDDTELQELADSIATLGILTPLTLRRLVKDRYQIIAGERRFRAAQKAGLKEVPAFIMDINEDLHSLELAIVENLQRVDLNPIELAHSFAHLLNEYNYTHEKLAERMSKPRSSITNTLRLLKLPPAIQVSLRDGEISEGHARAILSIDDIPTQLKICQQIIAQDLTVRATEQLCKSIKLKKSEGTPIYKNKLQSSKVNKFNERLTNHLGIKTYLKERNGRGKLIIEYQSQAELDYLLKKWGIDL